MEATEMKSKVYDIVEKDTLRLRDKLDEKKREIRRSLEKAIESGDTDEVADLADLMATLDAADAMLNTCKNLFY